MPSTAVITRGTTAKTVADLVVGLLVEVKAVRNGTTVTATRINIEDETPGTGTGVETGEDLELAGTLAALPTGTCPAVTFTLGGTTVTTSSATRFDDLTCASLAVGLTLRVEGVRQANGSVLASEVNRATVVGSDDDDDDSDDDGDDDSRQDVDMIGSLAARPAGSCPVITFTLNGATVVTSGTTRFDDVSCANLASGDVLRVKGLRQANGSIAASEVKKTGSSSGSGSNSGSGSSGSGSSGNGSSGSGSSGSGSSGSGNGR